MFLLNKLTDQIVVERKTYQEIFRVEALNHDARWRDVVVRLQLVRHFRRRDGRSRAPHNGNQGKVEGSLLGVDLVGAVDHTQIHQRPAARHAHREV
jgi:hypothetical protein